jgi:hypothetical protein
MLRLSCQGCRNHWHLRHTSAVGPNICRTRRWKSGPQPRALAGVPDTRRFCAFRGGGPLACDRKGQRFCGRHSGPKIFLKQKTFTPAIPSAACQERASTRGIGSAAAQAHHHRGLLWFGLRCTNVEHYCPRLHNKGQLDDPVVETVCRNRGRAAL